MNNLKTIAIWAFRIPVIIFLAWAGYLAAYDSYGDGINRLLVFFGTLIIILAMAYKGADTDKSWWGKDQIRIVSLSVIMAWPLTVAFGLAWALLYLILHIPFAIFSDISISTFIYTHKIEERFATTFWLANYAAATAFLASNETIRRLGFRGRD